MGKNDFWDDPEWNELRRRVNSDPTPKKKPKTVNHKPIVQKPTVEPAKAPEVAKKVEVSVKFSLPQVTLPKLSMPTWLARFSKKQITYGAIAAGVMLVIIIAILSLGGNKRQPVATQEGTTQGPKPSFATLLPDGKKESTQDNEVRFDSQRGVASFRDTIGNVMVTVSQQQAPPNIKSNPDVEVKKIAENFAANDIINESNPKAYLGTSAKGPQTVIFYKGELLIFILSDREIEKAQWAEYITKLI